MSVITANQHLMTTNSTNHQSITDWLYTDNPPVDSGSTNKQGALILFPRMIDRWNVTALLVSKWIEYKVVIVTDHPNEFMQTVFHSEATKWTDLELIPFPLVIYSDLDTVNSYMHNSEIDIIIFDDARMFATITPALNFSDIQPKIIILSTWGDTIQQLDLITSKIPTLGLLSLDLLIDTADINWKVISVPMSDRQLKYYDRVKANQSLTKMITLYAYPDSIMNDTLTHKNICETDQTSNPDNISLRNSWLTKTHLESLNYDGPKLQSLLDGVIANWPSKQVIFTRFNHRYGVDLIKSYLQLLIQDRTNPYEMNEIISISCTDNYEQTINILHKFNVMQSGVLISNIVPLVPLTNISVVHVPDSYSLLSLKALIDRIHKRYLTNVGQNSNLSIYSYVATHPKIKSADIIAYERFMSQINEANHIYSGLISTAGHIVFDPILGLIVK